MGSILSKLTSLKEEIRELQIEKDTKEYEILSNMNEILLEVVKKIDKMENNIIEINEYVTVLDENLGNVEEEVFGFEEEDEEFHSYDYIDIECSKCHEILAIEKDFLNEEDSITCPNCYNSISLKNRK